jgi:DNA mismatch repair protein MutS
VVLAQVGSFIPAAEGILPLRDRMFARFGAKDHQLLGLSTHLNEMIGLNSILGGATSESLVLLDEIGRSTSHIYGLHFTRAYLRYLADEIRCPTLVTTHFHELSKLLEDTFLSRHFSTEMRHSLGDRACAFSHGIDMAEQTDLPQTLIQSARKHAKNYVDFVGQIRTIDLIDSEKKQKDRKKMTKAQGDVIYVDPKQEDSTTKLVQFLTKARSKH